MKETYWKYWLFSGMESVVWWGSTWGVNHAWRILLITWHVPKTPADQKLVSWSYYSAGEKLCRIAYLCLIITSSKIFSSFFWTMLSRDDDVVVLQARHFIAATMGKRYSDAVILDYESMLTESDKTSPMVCFLTMGSDPTDSIERLARSKGIRESRPLVVFTN